MRGALAAVADWKILGSAAFMGLFPTVGLGLPALVGVGAAAAVVAVGAAAGALTNDGPKLVPIGGVAVGRARAVPGTENAMQEELLGKIREASKLLDAFAADPTTPSAVQTSAVEAASIGRMAVTTAVEVARAADQISAAKMKLWEIGRGHSDPAVQRLHDRHDILFARLEGTASQLLDVYSNLVETSATVSTTSIVGAGEREQLGRVNTSLSDLRTIAAELDSAAADEARRAS